MKKILVIAIILGTAWFFFMSGGGGANFLTEAAAILTYRIGDGYTDYAFVEVTFNDSKKGERYANIFSGDEWLVRNTLFSITGAAAYRFSFKLPEQMKGAELIALSVGITEGKISSQSELQEGDVKNFEARVIVEDIVEQFGLNVPGASEDLKRGVGIVGVAEAQQQDFELPMNPDVRIPDLTGGPMDCFAIATANNLIAMAEKNRKRNDLPADPGQIIDELKGDMQFNNGILNRNFMPGKAAFVARYGLPVTTREIKRPTLDDIEDAFSSGDAVEVSTIMIRSRSGKASTGHVLTGVYAYSDGEEAGISVHDPATPQGTDAYNLTATGGDTPYLMINYPLWDGLTLIDAIYIQNWNRTAANEKTGVAPEEKSGTTGTTETKPAEAKPAGGGGNVSAPKTLETTFAHVKPGEYSEVYAAVAGFNRGDDVTARLYGPGHNGTLVVKTVDNNGTAHFTWQITQYGSYEVRVEGPGGFSKNSTVKVE